MYLDDKLTSNYIMRLNLQFFADGPGGEKTEEPTAKKLSDARKEGQVAKSKDIVSSLTLFALFLLLKIWTANIAENFLELFEGVYTRFDDFVKVPEGNIVSKHYADFVGQMMLRVLLIIWPFIVSAFLIAFIGDLYQVKWKPTTKPLQPKFSKLNPINGIKRLFKVETLVELLKSLLKIAIVFLIIKGDLEKFYSLLFTLYNIPLLQAVIGAGDFLISVGFKISAIFLVIALIDYRYQKYKFHKDMKMTKQEVKEEYKSTEGDPQIKGKIRARMREASQRRMMQNLPKADVVITNPTHYAVAISYDADEAPAPIVIAKGEDYLAQKIKEVAKDNDIEIVENKPLARMLYANVDIGAEIPPELYQVVAEILVFVDAVDKIKAKEQYHLFR